MGGFRLLGLSERSRLGEESRDDGLEDRERGEMGLGWRQPEESSEKKIQERFPLFPTHFHIHFVLCLT